MNSKTITIDGRHLFIYGSDGADACVICGMENHSPNEITDTAELLYASEEGKRCRLVIFETTDWNGDFSPWPSAAAFGNEPFTGKAPETLSWITGALLPYLEREKILAEGARVYLAGYSLAGLFALWGFLESDRFDGAASCSGSLWLPGWMEYLETQSCNREGIVYLSLGTKEEKTKNTLMRAVGDNTRNTYEILRQAPCIVRTTLEWNSGGHFADTRERLVKGIRWLLQDDLDTITKEY